MRRPAPPTPDFVLLIVGILLLAVIALGLAALDAGAMLRTAVGVAILVLALLLWRGNDPPDDGRGDDLPEDD
jgi:hypothetical protein